jgi:hypothetical protein
VLLFYPVIVCFCSFYFFGFVDSSFSNLLGWLSTMLLTAISGATFGFLIGCIFDSDMAAIVVVQLFFILFSFGAGSLTNLGSTNVVVTFLSYISPFRYSCELFMRRLLAGREYKNTVLNFLDYTYGYEICYFSLIALTVFFILLAWLIIYLRSKSL